MIHRCITDFMSNKICVLATHQNHLLQNTTMNIITICEGNAYSNVQFGSYSRLINVTQY